MDQQIEWSPRMQREIEHWQRLGASPNLAVWYATGELSRKTEDPPTDGSADRSITAEWQITTPWGVFALGVNKFGLVASVEGAIGRWMHGQTILRITKWAAAKGYSLRELNK